MTFGGMGLHCKCFTNSHHILRNIPGLGIKERSSCCYPSRQKVTWPLTAAEVGIGWIPPLPRFHSHGSFMNWNQLNCVDRSAWSRAGGGPSPPPGAGAASAGGKRRKKKRKHWACYSRRHGNSLRPWSMDCASGMNLTPDGPISHSVLACVINGQNVTRWEVFRVITWCFMF